MLIPYLFLSGFSTYGSVMIYYGIHSFILVRMFIVKTICCNFYPLIQFAYLSIKMLTDVTLFRMAPPTRQNMERNDGSQANPPPPPPPPPPPLWIGVVGLCVSGVLRRPPPKVDPPVPWMLKRHINGIYDCVERHDMLWVNRLGIN